MAASPMVPPSQGLPLPVAAALLRPADWRALGANLAQDTRWPGVGKRDMSVPVSARISCAVVMPTPGISSSWATWAANGAMAFSIRVVSVAIRMASDPAMPLADLQWVMGHAHLSTTQRYLNPLPGDVIEAVLAFHARQRYRGTTGLAPEYRAESLQVL